jgi:hypothetical protein
MYLIDKPTCNKPSLDTHKFAVHCNKFTLTTSWMLRSDLMDKVSWQSWINRNLRISYRICINTMPLPVYIDRHHCYNKDILSVGTHLNLYYIHDSFFPFCFYFHWMQAVYFVHTWTLVCFKVILLVIKPLGIKKCNSNSANKSKSEPIKH